MDGNVGRAATELYPTVKADVFAFLKIVLERRGKNWERCLGEVEIEAVTRITLSLN
jgi:hypothetical protein